MRTIRKNVLAILASVVALSARAGEPGEPVDYGQLGAILGYVASDYPTAVGAKGILNAQEWAEQKGFLGEAVQLLKDAPSDEGEVAGLVSSAQTAAAAAAPPAQIVPKVTEALKLLGERHDLGTLPKAQPDLDRGQVLYQQACEECHAADGSGHTGLKLSTQPPDLTDPKDLGPLSPSRVFGAVTYGVPGTAMPAFREAYSDDDRWNLAFYAMALGHRAAGESAKAPSKRTAFALSDLARDSDDDLRSALAPQGAQREAVLAWLRLQGPRAGQLAPKTSSLLSGARRLVAEAIKRSAAGDRAGARHAAISAYLDNFEPFEAALRAKNAGLTDTIERSFMGFRNLVDSGASEKALQANADEIERLLQKAEDSVATASASVSFVASLAIALREGLEAALLLSAMLALAGKSGRPRAKVSVHLGWAGALSAGIATWFLSGAVLEHGGQRRELTEGVTVLLTAVLLLGASHWILAQASAKKLTSFLSEKAKLVRGAGWGLGGLAFFAIYREMFEIVVFYRGLLMQSPGQERAVAIGLLVGLVALACVVVMLQRVGRRLRPRPLLLACGALLCALSVMMVGEGVRSLQEAAVLSQHVLNLPEFPQLGLFATVEGLTAQLCVILMLAGSLGYSLVTAASAGAGAPGNGSPRLRSDTSA